MSGRSVARGSRGLLRARLPCTTQVTVALVAGKDYTLHVLREDDETLVLDGLSLARAFFMADPSAKLGGYDSLAGLGSQNRVVIEDVIAMNTTMRSRSKHSLWDPVLASDQRWLREIPPDLDMVKADENGLRLTATPCWPLRSAPASIPGSAWPAPPNCCISSGRGSCRYWMSSLRR
jgi:hypothetical protein